MRYMGKKEIGQMQPFELVISIMIADLASTPMSETGIPILWSNTNIRIVVYVYDNFYD
jgi:uncharacterized membrane protein YcaP (DUF421 family)